MASVGRSFALLRGRMTGDKEKAAEFLNSLSPAKRREINRQESQSRGSKRKKKPYRLGERLQVRK